MKAYLCPHATTDALTLMIFAFFLRFLFIDIVNVMCVRVCLLQVPRISLSSFHFIERDKVVCQHTLNSFLFWMLLLILYFHLVWSVEKRREQETKTCYTSTEHRM